MNAEEMLSKLSELIKY